MSDLQTVLTPMWWWWWDMDEFSTTGEQNVFCHPLRKHQLPETSTITTPTIQHHHKSCVQDLFNTVVFKAVMHIIMHSLYVKLDLPEFWK